MRIITLAPRTSPRTKPHVQKRTPEMLRKGWIYFVQADDRVKIGFSVDVQRRIRSLQVANPRPLTILGQIPGDKIKEGRLHHSFRKTKIRGEWFYATPELFRYIKAVCHG